MGFSQIEEYSGLEQIARQRFEEDYLRRAMARANGNVAEAARQIGIARQNLHLKLKRLGLVN